MTDATFQWLVLALLSTIAGDLRSSSESESALANVLSALSALGFHAGALYALAKAAGWL